MTRPDPNSPDPGANQDDAVWLDLVARLEGQDPDAPGDPSGDGSPADRTFKDFDPLGLSATPPVELSATERLTPAAGTAAFGPGPGQDTTGPRDYQADDDDGAFVPEEPPSLAGADPMTVLAWLGAVGGPVALVMAAMFWRAAPMVAILGIVAAFAASVIFLIMKLPREKDEHDDGARV